MWHDKLMEIKKRSGKTTDEISEISGISKGTLNKIFAGITKDPQLETIKTLLYSLGYSLNDLDDDIVLEQNNVCESDERQLIAGFNALNAAGKQVLLLQLKMMLEQDSYKKTHEYGNLQINA